MKQDTRIHTPNFTSLMYLFWMTGCAVRGESRFDEDMVRETGAPQQGGLGRYEDYPVTPEED